MRDYKLNLKSEEGQRPVWAGILARDKMSIQNVFVALLMLAIESCSLHQISVVSFFLLMTSTFLL